MPLAQNGQSDQPGIHEPWFLSGPCALHLGPSRSPPPAPVNVQMLVIRDPCELRLVYLPMFDQTDPRDLRLHPPGSPPPGPVNVEVSDEGDDLIILSPTSFRQPLSSRRTRRTHVESVEISARNQRRRPDPQPSHVNSEGTSSSMVSMALSLVLQCIIGLWFHVANMNEHNKDY
ncbi:hypothetical protein L1987_59733 [Smallanthus sonchifolius]|uniref:Uncharacterized protein n=1 Tax=Smallanthus sonchifolius TaxID=185202 RepID=A0ACB9D630_9ASTR|nr:hypothetical protein L1987_59733 [Smallanthus sonchifolius]